MMNPWSLPCPPAVCDVRGDPFPRERGYSAVSPLIRLQNDTPGYTLRWGQVQGTRGDLEQRLARGEFDDIARIPVAGRYEVMVNVYPSNRKHHGLIICDYGGSYDAWELTWLDPEGYQVQELGYWVDGVRYQNVRTLASGATYDLSLCGCGPQRLAWPWIVEMRLIDASK